MPRPRKWKRVGYIPDIKVFGPLNIDNTNNEIITLNVEELESMRLMDLEGLDQIACADRMGVARSTFQRIYSDAKRKMTDSLVNGKVLKIEGGNYTLNICKLFCENCGYSWDESFENTKEETIKCPKCGSEIELNCNMNTESDFCDKCRRMRNGCGRGRGYGKCNGNIDEV